MKVSVWMTAYNHEKYIAQALDSVLMQKVNFDYEIILGEDFSGDGTRDIVLDYCKRHPDKIRPFLPGENLGFRGNKISRETFRMCRGEYVALLDGDDYWTSPQKLQKQVDFLDGHPGCAICFHNAEIFYEGGGRGPKNTNSFYQKEISSIEDLLRANFVAACSAMVRRDAVGELPDWYLSIEYGDLSVYLLAAQHGKAGYINEVMSAYRVHSGGTWSGTGRLDRLKNDINFYEKMNCLLNFEYDRRVRLSLSRRCHELATAYEEHGDFGSADTYLTKCIANLTLFFEKYSPSASSEGMPDLKDLRRRLRFYRHPILYRLRLYSQMLFPSFSRLSRSARYHAGKRFRKRSRSVVSGEIVSVYEGHHDSAGCKMISGWAWDKSLPDRRVDVDIYVDNILLTTIAAGELRQDLAYAGKGDGCHAFHYPVPHWLKDGNPHLVSVKVAGDDFALISTPKQINCKLRRGEELTADLQEKILNVLSKEIF